MHLLMLRQTVQVVEALRIIHTLRTTSGEDKMQVFERNLRKLALPDLGIASTPAYARSLCYGERPLVLHVRQAFVRSTWQARLPATSDESLLLPYTCLRKVSALMLYRQFASRQTLDWTNRTQTCWTFTFSDPCHPAQQVLYQQT